MDNTKPMDITVTPKCPPSVDEVQTKLEEAKIEQ
jgi:hypothetical protein